MSAVTLFGSALRMLKGDIHMGFMCGFDQYECKM